jgi:hypothetical protein
MRIRLCRSLVGLFWMCFVFAPAQADDLKVVAADTRLEGQVYLLDARIRYSLSGKALDALHNSVPLTLELQIKVTRERDWLWDQEVASLQQRYQIRYYPLTEQYLVSNLNTGVAQGYRSLDGALSALGDIKGFPLLDDSLLQPGERYLAHLRVRLDIESLPAPLRPLAYLSSGWRLSSKWYSWRLAP